MDNPLTTIRLGLNLTIDQACFRAGITKQCLIRNEQAAYSRPSPKYLNYLLAHSNMSKVSAVGLYKVYQESVRVENYGLLKPDYFKDVREAAGNYPRWISNPFTEWRLESKLAISAISRLYCVHPAMVYKVERQTYLFNHLPVQLLDALSESGYSDQVLIDLKAAFRNYDYHLSHRIAG